MDEEESINVPTAPIDSYPPNNYTISAPEDPVFFATQQVEPVTPAPEDPSVAPTIFVSDVVPIPVTQAEGLTDAYTATDPNGTELPPSLTLTSIFPNTNIPFEGGTVCVLTGTNLDLVAEIRILGTIVPFTYVNPNTIQITTPVPPDNSAGTKSVELFDAFSVLQASDVITYDPQVAVFGLMSAVPNTGSMLGSEEIFLNGSAFFFISNITIGDQPVFDFQVLNSTTIRVVTPPGVVGAPVDIRVTSYDGSFVFLSGAFTYTYPPPFLLGVDKNSGDIAGGTDVTLAGAYLQGTTDVLVGGVSAGVFTVINESTIVFQTAPSVFTGIPLDVTVVTPNGTNTLFGAFTYSTTAPVPKITGVSPPTGIIATFPTVTIRGSGFTGTVQVEFDGIPASSYSVVDDNTITCTPPFGSYNGGNAVPVKVMTMDGSFTRNGAFTFVYDVPTVTSTTLTTDLVDGGTNGSLFGTNFYIVTAVTIAGVPVRSYTVVSPTQIDYVTGTAPNDTNPPGDIKVITTFGVGTLTGVFTYTYPVVTLANASINAGFAFGGTTVVLTGTGFTLVTQVLISGVAAASFTVDSLTQITCVTAADANPTNVPGDIIVQTVFSQAVLPNSFTYFSTMSISSSSISNGVTSGGDAGTLTGSNFANIQSLFIAGHAAASFTLVNSTTITFVTGVANTYGVLDDIVLITSFGENVVLPNSFIYYPLLSVSSVNINKGIDTGGETRTLTGTGFYSVTSVTVCGVAVTSFTTNTVTSLSFVTAANPTLGTGDIVVTTSYTSYTFTNGFTYYPAMQVSSINVSSGPATGGTTVVITGSGFFQVSSVQFNATEVTSFTVDSLTQITCVTASKSLFDGETGDVIVTSPYASATLSNVWTYWPTMSVVSLDVTNGPTTGGTTVVITGAGFYAVTSITFNNITVASFTVDSPSQITILTGIGALNGTGNVVVNSIFTSATKSNAWTYWQPMSVSTLSVTNGSTAGGTSVVITGVGFFSVTGVTFNGTAVASYTVNSLTQITVTTAAKVSNGDVGNVVVTSTYTSATKTNAWTYWPPMSVSSLNVSNGSTVGGTSVVIIGTGFYSVSGVTFNGVAVASYTVNSVTQITVTTGVGSANGTGDVVVTSNFTSATGTNLWTYWQPVVVSSLDVTNGPRAGGTTVVVTGSGFFSVSGVTFNGIAVSSYTVDSLTQITVVTGAKPASDGDVGNVVVTTNYTSGTKTNAWTYYPPMSVSSLDVSSGPKDGGTAVVITGAGFYSVNSVTFDGIVVTSYTVDSLTQITVTTAAAPSVTAPSTGDVVVTSNFTSATGTSLWTYYSPVVVSSLDVAVGNVSGGTTVNITGSGFYGVNSVTFKNIEVLSKTINSPTSITIVTKGDVTQLLTRLATGLVSNFISASVFACWAGGAINKFISPGSYINTSGVDGVSFTVADVPTSSGLRYSMYVPSLSKAFVVGGGNVANRFLESNDGITWTSPGVLPLNYSWNWLTYSPTLNTFVTVSRPASVGAEQLTPIATSTDGGATWTLYGTGTPRSFGTVTWCSGFGKFVATGFSNLNTTNYVVAYSSDGVTWTEVDLTAQISGDVQMTQSAEYSEDMNTLFVSGDTYGFVTTDGINWTRTPSSLPNNNFLANPKWISSLGVFVGQSGTDQFAYSADGLTWTTVNSSDTSGATRYSLAWSPDYDALLASPGTADGAYTFTNPENATGSVVVTSTYTSGTKPNCFTFSPKIVVGNVDVGYGPTAGGTTVKIYGRGFRDITSVTLKGVSAASFTVSTAGTVITAVTAAGTAGTGDIVVASLHQTGTLTDGWSYKNISSPTYIFGSLSSGAKTNLIVALNMRPVLSTYSGPLFRVLRTSDRAVTDVYGTSGAAASWFTKNGVDLAVWKGASTLKVVRWFDQSGSTRSTDTAVPKPPGSGGVFAYMYSPDKMPVLDMTANCIDFNAANRYMQMADSTTAAVTSPYTMTIRHGTVGNASNGSEFFNIGNNSSTSPGSGNYFRRSGNDYINTWPGNGSLTLSNKYADNQVVTLTYDLTSRSGFVQSALASSLASVLAGTSLTVTIGGRGNNTTTDSLAQFFSFNTTTSVYSDADRLILEENGDTPTLTSSNVSNGSTNGGTTVVLTGTNYLGVTGVSFNGVAAASFTVDSATQITAVTASTTAVGAVGDIVFSKPTGDGTITNAWTYWPPMGFTSIDVATGVTTGGTTVVITGAGFYAVSSVTFDGTSVASFTVDSATQITVSTGVSGVTSPTLGDVVVTSPYTSTTGTNVWTYYPPIVVSSLDVTYGPVSGGTTVNINGSGFHNVNSVTFKGIEVRSKTINSPTSMTVVVKGDVTQLVSINSNLGSGPPTSNFIAPSSFHCWAGGSIQKFIVPGTYVYTSNDAVTFTVADVPTPGSYRFAMYVPSLSKAFVIGNGNLADRFIQSSDGFVWTSPGVLPVNRSWNWAAYSPTLNVFVVADRASTALATPFAVSTDQGATWTQYGTGTNRSFGTVVWCTAMGKFVASGFSSVSPGIIAYSSNGTTWTEVNLATLFPSANVTIGQTAGVSEDLGIVWFGSGGNSFTSSDGINWQTGTNTAQINNPIWIESLQMFVSIKNATTYSYSTDGLVWTDVSANGTGIVAYGSFAFSPELDVFLATGTGSSYNFTNPSISTNNSVVVTSTYTTGTLSNAWAFVPTMAISDVDIGYGPTAGGTVVKIYGRGFRNINPGSVTFNGVQATSFTTDSNGCLITATVAAGTAGTGNIVCANSFRTATLTNGWSYKNTSVSSYLLDSISSGALSSVQIALNTKPVRSTYSGPIFRVWRDSDGAWTDVYGTSASSADWFTKNGITLATFKGTAVLRVVRWFDQSGNTNGTDTAIPRAPNAGVVFAYAYQPRYMPTLDLTNAYVDFSGGSQYLSLQDGVTSSGDLPYTITVRHGTTGNSADGEYFNIGTNSTTPPGSGNYLRRSGSDYVSTWPGNAALTLTGAYADNQVVTLVYDKSALLRTGYVQGSSAGTLAVTTAFTGNNVAPTIGGRGNGTVDSLAQFYHYHVALSAMGSSDREIFEDLANAAPLTVTSTDVPSGTTAGGTTVVITGTGFIGTTSVTFNGTAATSITVDSGTQITAVTAAGSAGRGDIVVTKPSGSITFTNGWTYFETNYTRFFAVTDISTTTGLNKTVNSSLTTAVYSSALDLFVVADSQSGISQPYVTSTDGTTWTRQTAPAASGNDSINDIAASSTAIVSVGILPRIRRSTNATSWTDVTGSNSVTFRIAYSPSLSRWAVGRGNNNGLYYSNDDGVTWSAATGAAVYVANVLWNSGLGAFYVFMRNGGSVYTSSDGISYTLAASSALATDNYHAAAYSSDRNEMMAIGNGSPRVYTSTDGITWTQKTSVTGASVVGLTWSSNLYMYVACTNRGLYTTVDGSAWVPMNLLTWSGTFDYSWGRWVYSPTARKGVAAYVNTVFRTEDTQRASLSFAASQNVQVANDTDLRPGAGDFTIEWFQYMNTPSGGTTPYVFSIANDLAVSVNGSTGLVSVFIGGSAVITNTPTDIYQRWCHFAVTRTGTTLGLFKDGVRLTTATNSTNIANTTDVLRIGNSSTTSSNNQFLGRITNFHFVTGTALYTTATYTVPTREIFPVANTKLFLPTPSDNLVQNYCTTTKTITNNGATSSTYNPFYL